MLILKSGSPRRKLILEELNLGFGIEPSDVNEDFGSTESPPSYLKRVTIAKLEVEKAQLGNVYISSDTTVVYGERIFAKPNSVEEGFEILSFLSGKIHSVYSGLGIWKNGEILYDFDETKVEFKNWGDLEIKEYLECYKPFDKAGSYGIQDKNGPVLKYSGSYSNVLGFPLRKFFLKIGYWQEYLG